MKRFSILAILFLVALAAAAVAVNPAQLVTTYAMFFTGSAGEPQAVTSANPLPTKVPGLSGTMRVTAFRIATATKTLLADIATGVPVPFWLSLENVGAGRVRVSDTATPTIWSSSIAASDSWAPRYYSATTTIQGSLMAPDGTVSTISALLEW